MSFERSLSVLVDIRKVVSTTGAKLGVNIDRRVVLETPRDTGSAKASWIVSTNSDDSSIVEWEGSVSSAETAAIEQGAFESAEFKSGDTLYIQNNQPYINRLNEGWSKQAETPGYIDAIIEQEVNRAD